MTWLNNTTVKCEITINGDDYSNEFVSGQVSDSSVVSSGFMLTSGNLSFVDLPGQNRLEDYDDTKFGRGGIVTIRVQTAGSAIRDHPRGHLRVLKAVYNAETRSLEVEVGCLLTLHSLTDDITALRSLTSFTLPDEAGFQDLGAALASESKFAWQKNNGTIVTRGFFAGDGLGSSKEAAKWVSVRNYTAVAVQPLNSGSPVPDEIRCTYTWAIAGPSDPGGGDTDSGKPEDID